MLEQGISPENVLLLTFTNKAAKEMKERIVKLVGVEANKIKATTFHSFCAYILRLYHKQAQVSEDFVIIDASDELEIMRIVLSEYILEQKKLGNIINRSYFFSPEDMVTIYDCIINNNITLEQLVNTNTDLKDSKECIREILKAFANYKKEKNYLDYNDLLFYTYRMLKNDLYVCKLLSDKYQYITVDEYQDTNIIQNDIVNLLAKENRNLAVVGDDNQSIYGWRGANISNILTFPKIYSDCKTVVLTENYRSSQEILDVSNQMMKYAQEGVQKDLRGQFNAKKPVLVVTDNNNDEASFVINKILEYQKQGVALRDMAVIFKKSSLSRLLELELNKLSIPYEKYGGIKFLEHKEVKDVLAFLRVLINPADTLSWYRILQHYPGVGEGYANKIAENIAENGIEILDTIYQKHKFHKYLEECKIFILDIANHSLLKQLFEISNYYSYICKREINESNIDAYDKKQKKEKLEKNMINAQTLSKMAEKYTNAINFVNDLSLSTDEKEEDDEQDKLILTTVHSAKGLEYDVVFILDVINGVYPSPKSDPNEELRCFYVAVTRAKKALYFLVPDYFTLYKTEKAFLSPYLQPDDVNQLTKISDKRVL